MVWRTEINLFLDAIKPFEKDEVMMQIFWKIFTRRIMTNIVTTNIDKRDVYIGPELFENEMQRGEFVSA
jgi:hypothetical protein